MRKKQSGQAFILVLILLAIGALLVVPSLRLTGTSLKSSQVVERQIKGLYAADAAQEFILWKLLYDLEWRQQQLKNNEDSDSFDFYVCDVPVSATVVMLARPSQGGTTLATEDKIKPTKMVDPSWVPDKGLYDYTYTIKLDYLSDINEDNPKVYLDAIYDFLPTKINNYIGPSEVFVDGEWREVPGPDDSQLISKGYLKWPADYNKDTREGAFSSHPEFYGIEDFEVREVKKLRFKVSGSLGTGVYCNWVVLKMDDGEEGFNTLSGPQAPIKVGGDPDIPGVCEDSSVVEVSKTSDPEIIQPGVATPVEYTISITNLYTQARSIREITDYLPPEFIYVGPTSSEMVNPSEGIQILEPEVSDPININGVDRREVQWTTQKFPNQNDISIASGQTLLLTFWAEATKDVSGSYYNEVIVILKESGLPSGWKDIGVSAAEYGNNYSWKTGVVMVPAYDSQSEAEGITINANMALILGGISITSWGVD